MTYNELDKHINKKGYYLSMSYLSPLDFDSQHMWGKDAVKFAFKALPQAIYFGSNVKVTNMLKKIDEVQFIQLNGELDYKGRKFSVE